ncbi:hypothetical protein LR48_Vigan09g118800 [Vigna angularis]|uniref:Uncharacterized protein n=1 Tax=Phaseolus angularis TaxID=3914 RepID=A0A0L9VD04_PHAAN|nr:hypothetical protein LR48_Vigan09g118800 [Vigna angularis]
MKCKQLARPAVWRKINVQDGAFTSRAEENVHGLVQNYSANNEAATTEKESTEKRNTSVQGHARAAMISFFQEPHVPAATSQRQPRPEKQEQLGNVEEGTEKRELDSSGPHPASLEQCVCTEKGGAVATNEECVQQQQHSSMGNNSNTKLHTSQQFPATSEEASKKHPASSTTACAKKDGHCSRWCAEHTRIGRHRQHAPHAHCICISSEGSIHFQDIKGSEMDTGKFTAEAGTTVRNAQ